MSALDTFLAYAADFEKTYADDDWSRLARYFGDAAVYRVESRLFGCELAGREAIFAGIKKSLDGFDRRFPVREIAVLEGPDVDGDELRMTWTVTYRTQGVDPLVLRGRSTAQVHDGKIVRLVDSYDDADERAVEAWVKTSGMQLDPSYV